MLPSAIKHLKYDDQFSDSKVGTSTNSHTFTHHQSQLSTTRHQNSITSGKIHQHTSKNSSICQLDFYDMYAAIKVANQAYQHSKNALSVLDGTSSTTNSSSSKNSKNQGSTQRLDQILTDENKITHTFNQILDRITGTASSGDSTMAGRAGTGQNHQHYSEFAKMEEKLYRVEAELQETKNKMKIYKQQVYLEKNNNLKLHKAFKLAIDDCIDLSNQIQYLENVNLKLEESNSLLRQKTQNLMLANLMQQSLALQENKLATSVSQPVGETTDKSVSSLQQLKSNSSPLLQNQAATEAEITDNFKHNAQNLPTKTVTNKQTNASTLNSQQTNAQNFITSLPIFLQHNLKIPQTNTPTTNHKNFLSKKNSNHGNSRQNNSLKKIQREISLNHKLVRPENTKGKMGKNSSISNAKSFSHIGGGLEKWF